MVCYSVEFKVPKTNCCQSGNNKIYCMQETVVLCYVQGRYKSLDEDKYDDQCYLYCQNLQVEILSKFPAQ